ncbi:unnamed protein product [Spirodela intermedia]|uniref:Uncharacterized protein n=2 Tax=Spirodela intermedia TaxID=51605 RepID=A0A7I8LJ06_SPIIN|nr:unnamed protein product [Spirodela intermedia]CAA6672612.1 unnamed protein product [Spirodela intermedia]CAA7409832.1 unnamed protein product [Spirodela intermedia]
MDINHFLMILVCIFWVSFFYLNTFLLVCSLPRSWLFFFLSVGIVFQNAIYF